MVGRRRKEASVERLCRNDSNYVRFKQHLWASLRSVFVFRFVLWISAVRVVKRCTCLPGLRFKECKDVPWCNRRKPFAEAGQVLPHQLSLASPTAQRLAVRLNLGVSVPTAQGPCCRTGTHVSLNYLARQANRTNCARRAGDLIAQSRRLCRRVKVCWAQSEEQRGRGEKRHCADGLNLQLPSIKCYSELSSIRFLCL